MMQLLERQFQENHRCYVFADELVANVDRLRGCFLGNDLPMPTATVIAAWNDVPNVTMSDLLVSMKTELVFIRAPPPTPTGPASDMDPPTPTSSDMSSNGGHDHDDDWLLVDDTTSAAPDVVVFQALEGSSATNEDDPMSRCSYPNQPLDRQINEEDPFQTIENNTLSSDQESLSSSGGASPKPVGFHNTVNQWLLDYRTRGMDAFIESLIAFGVVSVGTALLASRIARALVRMVAKVSDTEAKNLENTVRFSALAAFKNYWELVSSCSRLLSSRLTQNAERGLDSGIGCSGEHCATHPIWHQYCQFDG